MKAETKDATLQDFLHRCEAIKAELKSRSPAEIAAAERLEKWRNKWRDTARKLRTTRKLRGKSRHNVSVAEYIVWGWLELSESDRYYFTYTFWDDLKRKGIKFPVLVPTLLRFLLDSPSEIFRAIADYIDAFNACKGNRGARILASEKLYDYAEQVMGGSAKKLNWRELMEKFCTWHETSEDWQKFLRTRGIPFDPVGEFRRRAEHGRNSSKIPRRGKKKP